MGNPYETVSVSSYNADAPPDDGTSSASNQLSWSKHKEKLGDPLKTAIEAVNANTLSAFGLTFGQGISSKAISYAVLEADRGNFLVATAALTFTLPAAATAGDGFPVAFINTGTGVVTIDGNASETINGATSITIGPGEFAILTCDSASWYACTSTALHSRVQSKNSNYPIVTSDVNSLIVATAALTFTLPAAATVGAGFSVSVMNVGADYAIVDGNGSETINGDTTIVVQDGGFALLTCDGSNWFAMMQAPVQARRKTADETVNNSDTLQDDEHIVNLVVKPATYYAIDGFFVFDSSVTADIQFALTFTQAPQEFALLLGGTVSATIGSTPGTGVALAGSGVGTNSGLFVKGLIFGHATTSGTVKLQWAQNAVDATNTTLQKGSWLRLTEM